MKKDAPRHGSVRIIGGQWRSRRLAVADVDGLRPSGDRLRETLFNWLAPWLPGARCVDLFAGSGALGFEAVSRGAGSAVLVERDATASQTLRASKAALRADDVEIFQGSAEGWLKSSSGLFDIAFVDPPYPQGDQVSALLLLLQDRLAPRAKVFVELAVASGPPRSPESWHLQRSRAFGAAGAWLYEVA